MMSPNAAPPAVDDPPSGNPAPRVRQRQG
jgi:hypothetical protein